MANMFLQVLTFGPACQKGFKIIHGCLALKILTVLNFRRLHDDREEWGRQLDRKDQELLKHKETVEVSTGYVSLMVSVFAFITIRRLRVRYLTGPCLSY